MIKTLVTKTKREKRKNQAEKKEKSLMLYLITRILKIRFVL